MISYDDDHDFMIIRCRLLIIDMMIRREVSEQERMRTEEEKRFLIMLPYISAHMNYLMSHPLNVTQRLCKS
jgi:hypothetical protein